MALSCTGSLTVLDDLRIGLSALVSSFWGNAQVAVGSFQTLQTSQGFHMASICLSFLKFCLALVNIPVTWNLPLPLGLCYHWIHHCVTNTYALGCSTPLEVCISFAL